MLPDESVLDPRLNRILGGILDLFALVFPGRVRACYVDGSYADGTSVFTSDLDMTVVFRGQFHDGTERERAETLIAACVALSTVELDIDVQDEVTLCAGITPMLKFGSRLIAGEEIRETLPLIPIEAWANERTNAAYWLMIQVLHRPVPVMIPLTYPDPSDAFFGYAKRTVSLPDGTLTVSTRNLIRVTGWIATARLAREAGQYVTRKRDCHRLYRRWINDEWASLLDDIYRLCRGTWNYLVPESATDRDRLRAICTRTLAFENDFLVRYKAFVLEELHTVDDLTENRAVWVLARVPLYNTEIIEAVATRAAATTDTSTEIARAHERFRAFPQ